MNMKALFLGTAAAFAVVSGAQAADAIVAAAPEPMDYVKVCDAFGTGYFYIPGTETCLKISGLVRMNIASSTGASGFTVSSRGQITFDTANDSEYGKVWSSFYIRANRSNDTLTWASQYKAGIGGFEFGYTDGKYDAISGGFTDNGGSWGSHAGHYLAYNFKAGDFGGYVSLDHDNNSLNYTPDLSAAVNFKAGDAYGALGIGYDESDSSVALKGNVGTKFGAVGVRMMGAYANSATNAYWLGNDGWALGFGVSADVASNVNFAVDYQYKNIATGTSSLIIGDVAWAVAPGFKVLGEVSYLTSTEVTSGFVRFERKF